MSRPAEHPPIKSGRIGLLLVNLGTPDDLSVSSVRRYLKEFLSDRRVVNIPRIVWWPILNGIILNTRPKKSAKAYAKIWREEENESPLRYFTREHAKEMAKVWPDLEVDYAMRYGQPNIPTQMEAMREKGCDRILVVPLYPQYSATTNASVNDAVFDYLKSLRWQPTVRIAHPWYRHTAYIDALAEQAQEYLDQAATKPDKILLSFHGLPKESLEQGDPYYCHCQVTGRLLAAKLGWASDDVLITFQSRFGPAKWLQPYTSDVLAELPKSGVTNLLVLTPGFVADCIETLEEIAMEGVEIFEHAGGKHCHVLPCLNHSDTNTRLMTTVLSEELAGWI